MNSLCGHSIYHFLIKFSITNACRTIRLWRVVLFGTAIFFSLFTQCLAKGFTLFVFCPHFVAFQPGITTRFREFVPFDVHNMPTMVNCEGAKYFLFVTQTIFSPPNYIPSPVVKLTQNLIVPNQKLVLTWEIILNSQLRDTSEQFPRFHHHHHTTGCTQGGICKSAYSPGT